MPPPSASNNRSEGIPSSSSPSPAHTSLSTHLHHHATVSADAPLTSTSKRPASPAPSTSSLSRHANHNSSLRPQSSSSALNARITTQAVPSPATATASIGTTTTESSLPDERIWKSPAARKAERNWKRQSEKSLSSDSRYRKYAAVIDRALASFESVAEWADFVGALARLEKVSVWRIESSISLHASSIMILTSLSSHLHHHTHIFIITLTSPSSHSHLHHYIHSPDIHFPTTPAHLHHTTLPPPLQALSPMS